MSREVRRRGGRKEGKKEERERKEGRKRKREKERKKEVTFSCGFRLKNKQKSRNGKHCK
jgi:hypothetical protein